MALLTDKTLEKIVGLRHQLHQLAELSGKEIETAEKITEILRECAPDRIIEGLGETGLIATFEGENEGPEIMIRCELDALPIPEENDFEYRSLTDGVAHKCGHDGHMAIVAGIADLLGDSRPQKGRVHLLFQPSEETGQGAERILDDEKLEGIDPDYIFALHNLPGYPLHQVVLRDGVFASASRGFEVKLKGETSHAAHPENGRSPALALASLIQNFSAFPQYFAPLDDAAKVTVIQSRLGEIAFGTSPGYAEFRATIRTHQNELMEELCQKAEQLVENVAQTHDLKFETSWTELFEATQSDTECNKLIEQAASANDLDIHWKESPFPWSEDFGRFTSRYKGAIFGLGAGEKHVPLHSTRYDFPDDLIRTGISIFIDIIKQINGING
ncbi:amidohydrolase [Aliifodinibius sp. S!AR15-10]|uniref:amidohydrolase n=1 Tax=Aliifodinibius sp. S!AR15-10 TaxID=2950437 RepID=UPI002854630B|nr:amidohydrolase [Aliifodinibius sp. S!AR15-10]MDR8394413.1 amidohydrolase [Aliifodinibius sp. S!AR15-10]